MDSTHIDAHYLRADLLAWSNRPEEAEEGYRRAAALDSRRADVLWGLGKVYMQQGQYLQAAEVLRRAVDLEPRNTHALYLLSQAHLRSGQPDEREKTLESFQRLSAAQRHYKQGVFYAERGALDEARKALQEALALDPDHPRAREKLAQLDREQ